MIEIALLKPAAVKIAGSLCASVLTKKLSGIQANKAKQQQIQHCVEELCEQWLISVLKSLSDMDYPNMALWDFFQHYSHDLEDFVKDEAVAEELLKPLGAITSK